MDGFRLMAIISVAEQYMAMQYDGQVVACNIDLELTCISDEVVCMNGDVYQYSEEDRSYHRMKTLS